MIVCKDTIIAWVRRYGLVPYGNTLLKQGDVAVIVTENGKTTLAVMAIC